MNKHLNPSQYAESATQNRVIKLFQKLGYEYLGDWRDRRNTPVEESLLLPWLEKRGWSQSQARAAVDKLRMEARLNGRTLFKANKAVYSMLRYGVNVRLEAGENDRTIFPIDWDNPLNNHFAIAEEVTLKEGHERRPDLVIYINGIAVAVIELKRGSVSLVDGIVQLISNQQPDCNPGFFSTVQLLVAGNNAEGLKYGTIGTPSKLWLAWKEPGESEDLPFHRQLSQMFARDRLIEFMKDFVLFDAGRKLLPRPHQYFAIKASQEACSNRQGGIIWHSQGSGKSLVMVLLARWILANLPHSRVLVVTDRIELDRQIENVFRNADEGMVKRITSGTELVPALQEHESRLLCALLHKFGSTALRGEQSLKEYAKRQQGQPSLAVGEMFVFVDECHRSQGGNLYKAMRAAMPHAVFIGFTGTPLLRADRQTTRELFGGYIHTYKFDEAVADGVVLDLLYEARDIDQRLGSKEKVDALFEQMARGLNKYAREKLQKRWATMQELSSSAERMGRIVSDVCLDFATKPILEKGYGNALLVAASIRDACKYYELFQRSTLKGHVGLVTSYNPTRRDAEENMGANSETDKQFIYKIYMDILANVTSRPGKTLAETYTEQTRDAFSKDSANMKVVIVVDKLLTGFDAVPCSYIYIDKHLQDHGLFQAICRTNRVARDEEDWKDFGRIIDYKDLCGNVEQAIAVYTSDLDIPPDGEDPQIVLKNRLKILKSRLDAAREEFAGIWENVPEPKGDSEIIRHFCGNPENVEDLENHLPLRNVFYNAVVKFSAAYLALAEEMTAAGYSEKESSGIARLVKTASYACDLVRAASGEDVDLRPFESDMRDLLDRYVAADESRKIGSLAGLPLLDVIGQSGIKEVVAKKFAAISKEAQAECIENNIRRAINDANALNPDFYAKMSEMLADIIKRRKQAALDYEKYLKELEERIINPMAQGHNQDIPPSCDTPPKRALYENLGNNEGLALAIDEDMRLNAPYGWRDNPAKQRSVKGMLFRRLQNRNEVERIFALLAAQREYK